MMFRFKFDKDTISNLAKHNIPKSSSSHTPQYYATLTYLQQCLIRYL